MNLIKKYILKHHSLGTIIGKFDKMIADLEALKAKHALRAAKHTDKATTHQAKSAILRQESSQATAVIANLKVLTGATVAPAVTTPAATTFVVKDVDSD